MPNDDSTLQAWLRQREPEAAQEDEESQAFFQQHAFPQPQVQIDEPASPQAPAQPEAPGEPAELEQPEGVQANSRLLEQGEEETEFFSVTDTVQGLAAGAVEGTANILDTTSQLLEKNLSIGGTQPDETPIRNFVDTLLGESDTTVGGAARLLGQGIPAIAGAVGAGVATGGAAIPAFIPAIVMGSGLSVLSMRKEDGNLGNALEDALGDADFMGADALRSFAAGTAIDDDDSVNEVLSKNLREDFQLGGAFVAVAPVFRAFARLSRGVASRGLRHRALLRAEKVVDDAVEQTSDQLLQARHRVEQAQAGLDAVDQSVAAKRTQQELADLGVSPNQVDEALDAQVDEIFATPGELNGAAENLAQAKAELAEVESTLINQAARSEASPESLEAVGRDLDHAGKESTAPINPQVRETLGKRADELTELNPPPVKESIPIGDPAKGNHLRLDVADAVRLALKGTHLIDVRFLVDLVCSTPRSGHSLRRL